MNLPIKINPVKALQRQCGMDQTEFARALGVVVTSVSRWESGRNKPRLSLEEMERRLHIGSHGAPRVHSSNIPPPSGGLFLARAKSALSRHKNNAREEHNPPPGKDSNMSDSILMYRLLGRIQRAIKSYKKQEARLERECERSIEGLAALMQEAVRPTPKALDACARIVEAYSLATSVITDMVSDIADALPAMTAALRERRDAAGAFRLELVKAATSGAEAPADLN